jgi:hypothetical protein
MQMLIYVFGICLKCVNHRIRKGILECNRMTEIRCSYVKYGDFAIFSTESLF